MKLYILMPRENVRPKPTLTLSIDLANHEAQCTGGCVIPFEFDLRLLVQKYFEFRRYVDPSASQAFFFLTSEVGECADKFVHDEAPWVRNNPDRKNSDVAGEIGDALMMLTKFAEKIGVDPIDAMFAKWKRKGFVVDTLQNQ